MTDVQTTQSLFLQLLCKTCPNFIHKSCLLNSKDMLLFDAKMEFLKFCDNTNSQWVSFVGCTDYEVNQFYKEYLLKTKENYLRNDINLQYNLYTHTFPRIITKTKEVQFHVLNTNHIRGVSVDSMFLFITNVNDSLLNTQLEHIIPLLMNRSFKTLVVYTNQVGNDTNLDNNIIGNNHDHHGYNRVREYNVDQCIRHIYTFNFNECNHMEY